MNAVMLSQDDEEIRQLLDLYPALRYHLTWLINAYREVAKTAMQDTDTVDTSRSLAKKDNVARRLGIQLLETSDDWNKWREDNPK